MAISSPITLSCMFGMRGYSRSFEFEIVAFDVREQEELDGKPLSVFFPTSFFGHNTIQQIQWDWAFPQVPTEFCIASVA